MSYPAFPFIGAGEASYFERAEMFVCFARIPTKAEASEVGKRVPAPLRDTIKWDGALLWVASEQGVGRLITAAYKKAKAAPTKLTTQSRFKAAPTSAYARFNADIDGWLLAADTRVPILVAYRREDLEAGGTQLSDWHHASLPALPKVITELARTQSAEVARLGTRLVAAAARAKLTIGAKVAARFEKLVAAAEDAKAEEWDKHADAVATKAKAALGKPAPRYKKPRTDLDTGAIAKLLPATTKRMQRMAGGGLTLRPGASSAAIAVAEKALGTTLTKEHRALLAACDGGQLGEITLLGTATGGAKGDAEIVTFTRAWCVTEMAHTIVAHTGRKHVIAIPVGKTSPVYVLMGTPGFGAERIMRRCKSLDVALDLAIKAGRVWNNLAS